MSSADLAAKARVTKRQIDHWFDKGYLKALRGGSSSNAREMESIEVTVAMRIGRMLALGFNLATAAEVARQTHDQRQAFAAKVARDVAW
jgi:DNA-binding transcriptional MerR regulator